MTDTTVETVIEAAELQEIKRKSVSGAASYFIRTIFLNAITIVASIILSAYLSPADFGIYGYVTQFVGIFVFFSDIGLAAALVQKKSEPTLEEYRSAFTVQQLLAGAIFLGFIVLAATGFVQQKTGSVGLWLLLALGVSFPLASLKTIPSIMLERRLDFQKLVVPQLIEQLVYTVLLVGCVLKGFGVQSYTIAILARSVVGVIAMMVVQPWSVGLALDRPALRHLLQYGVKFQLNDFIARVKDQFFFIYLGQLMPLTQFGYVNWAKTWSMQPYNLTVQNVTAITFPTYSRLQHDKIALAKAINKSLFFITLLIFPVLVGMAIFIFPITELVPKFTKWQPAAWSLVWFSLSIAWAAISTPLTNTLNAMGKINSTLKLMVFWTVLTWVLTPLMLRWFGVNGVAFAAFLISCSSFLPIVIVRKTVPIRPVENIWRQVLAAMVMSGVGLVGLTQWSQSVPWMLVGMGVTGLSYVVVMLAIGWQRLLAEWQSLRRRGTL